MLSVVGVRSEKKSVIPAITHIDGTARIHVVRKETNPLFYRLIQAIDEKTNIPIVMNTSFNLQGEAIVNTPYDALETFSWSGLDFLAMGQFLISKSDFKCRS